MKLFSENDIYHTYNKFVVKDNQYFNRFIEYKNYLSESELTDYQNFDVPRVMSIIDFKDWIKKYNIQTGNDLLSTCTTDIELRYIKYDNTITAPYPPHDLHSFNLNNKQFDFIIFNQTLEHLYNPFLAVSKLYDHLKDGGYIYTTVPTINIPHMTPIHFWGITPIGLCMLFKSFNFQIMECGYWGNCNYINYIFENNTWPGHKQLLNKSNTLKHDNVCQAQTWILAKK
jgi:SAM-dependent methyltransferase